MSMVQEFSAWSLEGAAVRRVDHFRCFKTHLTADRFPIDIGRYIFILRDVRDVAVSAYHHNRLLGFDVTLNRIVERFLRSTNDPRFPTWFQFVESWWPHRDRPNVLFLKLTKTW